MAAMLSAGMPIVAALETVEEQTVNPNFKLALHIDTDEGNAAHITTGAEGFIEEIQNRN